MTVFKNLNVAEKLRGMILLTCGLALLLASMSYVIIDIISYRQSLVERISVISDFITTNTTAALVFDDPTTTSKLLHSLNAEKTVEKAVIFNAKWQSFAMHNGGDESKQVDTTKLIQWQRKATEHRHMDYQMSMTYLYMLSPIILDQEVIGYLYIESTLASLYSRLLDLLGIVLLVWGSIMLGIHFLAIQLQKSISVPIQRLVGGMREVSAKQDYSLRLEPGSNDEIGSIIKGFNSMLDQVQERDERLELHRQALEETNRAKSVFLATMSHEIRTPMNGVLGMAELLLSSQLSSKQQQLALTIQQSGKNLLQIINEILDLSKIEAGRIELECLDFNVGSIIDEVIELLSERARQKELQLLSKLPPVNLLDVSGDPAKLRQILINLVGNAIKFTEQGEVSIEVARLEEQHNMVVLQFAVSDTGIGIAEPAQQRIFEAFTQADDSMSRNYGGTGLGLSISKQLVELMGGQMGLESQLGQGSRFHFSLTLPCPQGNADSPVTINQPVAKARVASDTAKTVLVEQPDTSKVAAIAGARILLVEDNQVNQAVALGMLEHLGCQCVVVNNGKEALQAVTMERFGLVLMDCHMPELDGFETTRRIRQMEANTGGHVPIVALTANAFKGNREKCLAAGMDDYLSKPFVLSDLSAILCQWSVTDFEAGDERGNEHEESPQLQRSSVIELRDLHEIKALQQSGAPDILGRVIEAYLDTTPGLIKQLTVAVTHRDDATLYQSAHSLKSSSANIGARVISAICKELEMKAKGHSGSDKERQKLVDQLKTEFELVQVALLEELAS